MIYDLPKCRFFFYRQENTTSCVPVFEIGPEGGCHNDNNEDTRAQAASSMIEGGPEHPFSTKILVRYVHFKVCMVPHIFTVNIQIVFYWISLLKINFFRCHQLKYLLQWAYEHVLFTARLITLLMDNLFPNYDIRNWQFSYMENIQCGHTKYLWMHFLLLKICLTVAQWGMYWAPNGTQCTSNDFLVYHDNQNITQGGHFHYIYIYIYIYIYRVTKCSAGKTRNPGTHTYIHIHIYVCVGV